MIGFLIRLFRSLARCRKKKRGEETQGPKTKTYASQKVAYKYCLAAFLLFGLQGIIALAGALDLIFPDIPAPVTFNAGRSVHLNLSVLWPLLGMMGAVYYFFIAEGEVELYSTRLANIQFWLFLASVAGALGTLAFGLSEGREYLEALWPWKVGIGASLVIMAFNLIATLFKPGARRERPALILIITAVISAILLFLPNLFAYSHPTSDEIIRFWVVHLWEELSFEIGAGAVLASLLLTLTQVPRKKMENLLYIEGALVFLAGLLATGHHYYWVGTPRFWLYVGGIASVFQVIPILLMVHSAYQSMQKPGPLIKGNLVALGLLGSSIFWHVTGAGLMGLLIAIPKVNRYIHGTYITSAHSHWALFGVFGFFVLGVSHYILTCGGFPVSPDRKRGFLALMALNGGLAIMGLALIIAGTVEVYLWRYLGYDFMEVHGLLKPYMIVRGLGGLLFSYGALILNWEVISLQVRNFLAKLGLPIR